jgi:hypothetical protein
MTWELICAAWLLAEEDACRAKRCDPRNGYGDVDPGCGELGVTCLSNRCFRS